MPKLVCEKSFEHVFGEIHDGFDFGEYFHNEIVARGWNFLYYHDYDMFYTELADEFYGNIQFDRNTELLSTRVLGIELEITAQIISLVTHIDRRMTISEPMRIEDYMSIMGPNIHGVASDNGIRAKEVYRNVCVVGRWITSNILGSSHLTSFHRPALHLIHCLMIREPVDLCRVLLFRLAEGGRLPMLVQRICEYLINEVVLSGLTSTLSLRQLPREHTSTYLTPGVAAVNWTAALHHEDEIRAGSERESDEEVGDEIVEPYWTRQRPRESKSFAKKVWSIVCTLGRKINRGVRKRKQIERRTTSLEARMSALELDVKGPPAEDI